MYSLTHLIKEIKCVKEYMRYNHWIGMGTKNYHPQFLLYGETYQLIQSNRLDFPVIMTYSTLSTGGLCLFRYPCLSYYLLVHLYLFTWVTFTPLTFILIFFFSFLKKKIMFSSFFLSYDLFPSHTMRWDKLTPCFSFALCQ